MKRWIIALIVLVLVAGAAYYLYDSSRNSLNAPKWREFAVEDTAAITKVFLADKAGNKVLVERQLGKSLWRVNGKYDARPDVTKYLLETIKTVSVKTPVPKPAQQNVMRKLAAGGIKVEIYTKDSGDEPEKVYYVGGETSDQMGTFMMLEGSPIPFITEIKGFFGYLTPRYSPKEIDWRDIIFFRLKPDAIAKVEIQYPPKPEEGFVIDNTAKQPTVSRLINEDMVPNPDMVKLQKYLGGFTVTPYESVAFNLKPEKVDSILKTSPFAIFNLKEKAGKTHTMKCFYIKRHMEELDENGKPLPVNTDKFHIQYNNSKELFVAQFYVWDRVLVPFSFFNEK